MHLKKAAPLKKRAMSKPTPEEITKKYNLNGLEKPPPYPGLLMFKVMEDQGLNVSPNEVQEFYEAIPIIFTQIDGICLPCKGGWSW